MNAQDFRIQSILKAQIFKYVIILKMTINATVKTDVNRCVFYFEFIILKYKHLIISSIYLITYCVVREFLNWSKELLSITEL